MAKLLPIGDSYGLIVPRPLLEQLRWLHGDELLIEMEGNHALYVRATKNRKVGIRDLGQGTRRARPGASDGR